MHPATRTPFAYTLLKHSFVVMTTKVIQTKSTQSLWCGPPIFKLRTVMIKQGMLLWLHCKFCYCYICYPQLQNMAASMVRQGLHTTLVKEWSQGTEWAKTANNVSKEYKFSAQGWAWTHMSWVKEIERQSLNLSAMALFLHTAADINLHSEIAMHFKK